MKIEIESKFDVGDCVKCGDRVVHHGVVAEVALRKYADGYRFLYAIETIGGGSIFRRECNIEGAEEA